MNFNICIYRIKKKKKLTKTSYLVKKIKNIIALFEGKNIVYFIFF